jgi:hypothetical protein
MKNEKKYWHLSKSRLGRVSNPWGNQAGVLDKNESPIIPWYTQD